MHMTIVMVGHHCKFVVVKLFACQVSTVTYTRSLPFRLAVVNIQVARLGGQRGARDSEHQGCMGRQNKDMTMIGVMYNINFFTF